jgi:site-specific recombinase XerD
MATTVTSGSIEEFLTWSSARGRADNTIRSYRADLTLYIGQVGEHPIEEFENKAAAFINEQRKVKQPQTIKRYLGSLRVYGRWMGLRDPLEDYIAPTPAKPQPHPIPEGIAAVQVMCNIAPTQKERNLVALCGLAGLRVHEATTVRVKHVNLVERTLTVRGKGDKTRVVPVSDALLAALAPSLDGLDGDALLAPMHERAARKAITRIAARCVMSRRVSSHDLRATFATAAYNKTGDLRAVQELLGHSDIRTTEVYTGITMAQMRVAAEVV